MYGLMCFEKMSETYSTLVQKDQETEDLFFEIPPKLLKELGWEFKKQILGLWVLLDGY